MISKKWIISIIVVILLSGIGYYFYDKNKNTASVELVSLQNVMVTKSVSASGEIKSNKQSDLTFVATGKITQVRTDKGQSVKKGQLLASINTATQSQNTQAAKDQRDTIIREKDIFIKDYGNDMDDFGGKERYLLQIRKYDEQISQAEANYKAQANLLPNYYIYAPFDGTVVDVTKKVGETATAGETIIKLADLTDLFFEVKLDQEDFGEIKIDQTANITFDTYPNQIFGGTVYQIPQFTEAGIAGGSFVVKIEMEANVNQNLLLGMTGDAEIITNKTESNVDALIFDEIFTDDSKYYVWIINDQNKLERQEISIGLEGDIYTQVTTDLSDKRLVVPSDKKQTLTVGQQAKIVSQ